MGRLRKNSIVSINRLVYILQTLKAYISGLETFSTLNYIDPGAFFECAKLKNDILLQVVIVLKSCV